MREGRLSHGRQQVDYLPSPEPNRGQDSLARLDSIARHFTAVHFRQGRRSEPHQTARRNDRGKPRRSHLWDGGFREHAPPNGMGRNGILFLQRWMPGEVSQGTPELRRKGAAEKIAGGKGTRFAHSDSGERGIHLPDASGGAELNSRPLPEMRYGSRIRHAGGVSPAVDMSDAPADHSRRPRKLPDLWHGAGADDGFCDR